MSDAPDNSMFYQYCYMMDGRHSKRAGEIIDSPKKRYAPMGSGTAAKEAHTPASAAEPAAQGLNPSGDQGNTAKRPAGDKAKQEAGAKKGDFKLEFTGNSLMNAVILSELLGKPKILQKRRW